MKQYLEALETILIKGKKKVDRTGVGTYSYCQGIQLSFNLEEGYPICTTKRVYWKSVVAELLWFLYGSTKLSHLQSMNCHIWDAWQKEGQDDLGPVYGYQWRSWMAPPYCGTNSQGERRYDYQEFPEMDQIGTVAKSLVENPWSRRHIVTAWNPLHIQNAALPPCHVLFQFTVDPDEQGNPKYLNCHLYQRSADFFIGVPFNIASYSLLTILLAKQAKLTPGYFVHSFGDAHIYQDHISQILTQLRRPSRGLPTINLQSVPNLITMKWEDDIVCKNMPIQLNNFGVYSYPGRPVVCIDKQAVDPTILVTLENYNPHPFISAPVAV